MELHIRDVKKPFANGVQALKDVTLTIPVGMHGPNGAGKSTLMRILATLQEPDEGSIRLRDIDVLRQKGEVRQTLGTFSGGMRQRFGDAVALLGNPRPIILDDPTAGLDLEERVRFLNLLSEIGEASAELCSRMAIIDGGAILLEAEPARAMDELWGRLCRRTVSRTELPAIEAELPDPEDVCFSVMEGHHGRRTVASETEVGGAS